MVKKADVHKNKTTYQKLRPRNYYDNLYHRVTQRKIFVYNRYTGRISTHIVRLICNHDIESKTDRVIC